MTLIADIAGERLDAFLARCGENLSRSAAQRLIEEGHVTRNGKPGKKNDKLNMGDVIEFTLPEVKLKEFVGHTPIQVMAGILIGIADAVLLYLLVY